MSFSSWVRRYKANNFDISLPMHIFLSAVIPRVE
jgi:hypothetical protein